jgi:hypothetical protein
VRAVQPLADLPPQGERRPVAGVVLDQRVGHVHPEPGHPALQPEADDLPQRGPVGQRPGGVDRLSPGLGRVEPRVAEVQRRLGVVEVLPVVARPRTRGGHELLGRHVGPDVAVVGRIGGAGPEPRVVGRGVPGHQVQQHPDATLAGRLDEPEQVVVAAVAGRDPQVVGHVVAGVAERGGEARVEPDRVHAEPGQVVEPGQRAGEVADAVAVGVGERLRVDLVEHGLGQPVGRRRGSGHPAHHDE